MKRKSKKPILYVIPCNHFDLAWRRPFRHRLHDNGNVYVSYSDLEQYYIEDNLALCRKYPEYKFQIESVHVAKEYLDRFPEKREQLVCLASEGRFGIPGSGDAIIDTNMVLGETIVRNFVLGILWAERMFGQKTRIAYRADAFGNSAQLPQILRGCEMDQVLQLSYTLPKGKYWAGLDGSTVLHTYIPDAGDGGYSAKYAPCGRCGGTGTVEGRTCPACKGRGIDTEKALACRPHLHIAKREWVRRGYGYILLNPEEFLPQAFTIEEAQSWKADYDVRFSNFEEPTVHLRDLRARLDHPDPKNVHDSAELNPNNTGCYVTRIGIKQNLRRQEYRLLAAETLSVFRYLANRTYPAQELEALWGKVLFSAFHDTVCGTYVDAVDQELAENRDLADAETDRVMRASLEALSQPADGVYTILNPTGCRQANTVLLKLPGLHSSVRAAGEDGKDVPVVRLTQRAGDTDVELFVSDIGPFGSQTITCRECGEVFPARAEEAEESGSVIQNDRFRITADRHGLLSIYDKKLGREISGAGTYRPGEFVLEHDEGSPWATLSADRTRIRLSGHTALQAVRKSENREELVFRTEPINRTNQNDVQIECSVILVKGLDRIDFKAAVRWDTYSQRLRVAFPVTGSGKQIYGIPYGFLERRPYRPTFTWTGRNGDWPAVNWAGVEGADGSVAVLNKGLPSYAMSACGEDTLLFLSILRSPCVPTYLHEPGYYTMKEWDGMRDAGVHTFEYAVTAYGTSFAESGVVADAQAFNAGLIASGGRVSVPVLPALHARNACIASVKRAENGQDLAMRLVEFRGVGEKAELEVPGYVKAVQKVNLLERCGTEIPITGGKADIVLRPFEIATLLFELEN